MGYEIFLFVGTSPLLNFEGGFAGIVDEVDWARDRLTCLKIEGREHTE
jgi:hypothetical protein